MVDAMVQGIHVGSCGTAVWYGTALHGTAWHGVLWLRWRGTLDGTKLFSHVISYGVMWCVSGEVWMKSYGMLVAPKILIRGASSVK